MPVAVKVGSRFVEVRARGSFSVAVIDPAALAVKVPDPENLTAYLRSLVTSSVTEMIGERSYEVSTVAQLTAITAQTTQELQTKLEAKFKDLGLQLKKVSIEALESL
jgi:membrane protease subunit (stomatin/prohibitin family)